MHSRRIQIAPSMMCADFLHLEEEVRFLESHGVDWMHVDIMDGHYVPNFTLGIDYCQALSRACRMPFDVHLMVEHPEAHVEGFASLPGARLTFHPETVRQPIRLIERIRELGASPGLALDPSHTVDQFRHLFPLVDQVLVMTVNPGYAGQKLQPHCLDKIAELRALLDAQGLKAEIEVDGNVSWDNIPRMIDAGADILVVGTSSLFQKGLSREDAFTRLAQLVQPDLSAAN
ncbi:ribulose-phosphate 3-epimerase [Spartobacteria bacterium LR76]|nr:ribulose-phosphate 3-epimerase [Spartobacteria bacterium LR76]